MKYWEVVSIKYLKPLRSCLSWRTFVNKNINRNTNEEKYFVLQIRLIKTCIDSPSFRKKSYHLCQINSNIKPHLLSNLNISFKLKEININVY